MTELPFRQIHLDFHTSPLIPDVGIQFDPEEFVSTLKAAHVNSVNIFAKCHHGMSYYPSKVGPVHPSLKFDLLGQMIEVLHKNNIKCPIYTTVVWDEHAAENHPEWRQMDSTGKLVGREPYGINGWRYLCLNTGYMDYLEDQIEEIVDRYEVDGMWYDIVMYTNDGCSCKNCLRDMKAEGLDPTNQDDRITHTYQVVRVALERLYKAAKRKNKDALVFINCRQSIETRPDRNLRKELPYMTHFEIESLPSGFWGYNHFPMFAKYYQTLGIELIGMNGKFHKMWGDFGGYKNKAALEYECFNMLANGTKVCVGDQLHPRGKLDAATYELIGSVFEQIECKEPWCSEAKPLADIAIYAVNEEEYDMYLKPSVKTLEAAMQMLMEDHRLFEIIDAEADFGKYELIVFPDIARLSDREAGKVQRYLENGGKVLLSGESGLKADRDEFALDLGLKYEGDSLYTTTYWRPGERVSRNLYQADYAMYERGKNVTPTGAEVLAQVVHPYFERDWDHFMSHFQTAADRESPYAAVVKKNNAVYIADPVFTTYKKHGSLVCKTIVSNCIDLLLGGKIIETNLPSTAHVTVLDQERQGRRNVHILHYPISRRCEIDIIEDWIPLHDISVKVKSDKRPQQVYLAPQREPLPYQYENGYVSFEVPVVNGHQIIALE